MRERLRRFDFYGHRRLLYLVSAVVIAAGLISLALPGYGLRLGIDFSGGSILEAKFERADVTTSEVRSALEPLSLGEPIIQRSAEDPALLLIRTKAFDEEQRLLVEQTLRAAVGQFEVVRFEGISPVIGRELGSKALLAVGIASALMLLYITFRFEFRFGVAAIAALLHDVVITVGLFSLARREVNAPFIAALLTVVGYSINDTIVIFDRVRENLRAEPHGIGDFGPLVNRSLAETMTRSINTSATTLLAILAVFLFGGRTTRDFALALIIGVLSGTYSSIFIASPIWASWREASLRAAAGGPAGAGVGAGRARTAAAAGPGAGRRTSAPEPHQAGLAAAPAKRETSEPGRGAASREPGRAGGAKKDTQARSKSRRKRRRR